MSVTVTSFLARTINSLCNWWPVLTKWVLTWIFSIWYMICMSQIYKFCSLFWYLNRICTPTNWVHLCAPAFLDTWLHFHCYLLVFFFLTWLYVAFTCVVLMLALTLLASLSGTFLQTLPDLVTPLKGHSTLRTPLSGTCLLLKEVCRKPLFGVWGHSSSPRSCPATRPAPSERFGYW